MAVARRAGADAIEQRVVDAALAIAAESGWDQVRLSTIADRIRLPLPEIGRHFRDVDAIANAWFVRARLAMLALPAKELAGRPVDERIALAFVAWLDSLAPHRRVAAEVLRHKLYPSHPHHWVPLVFDLSRLVHDLLDVARVPGSGRLRQAQEIGLTAITLVTLADWLRDDSPAQEHSKHCLRQRLARAGRLARWMRPAAETARSTASGAPDPATNSATSAPRRRGRGAASA
jgi:AcrR family transcriptional regulator